MFRLSLIVVGSIALGAVLSYGWTKLGVRPHSESTPTITAQQTADSALARKPQSGQSLTPVSQALRSITYLTGEYSRTLALLEALDGAEPSTVGLWIDTAVAELYGDDLVTITGLLYSYLADLDADFAIAKALGAPLRQQGRWLTSIFARLASIDLPNALERAGQLEPLQGAVAARAILRERNDIESEQRKAIAASYGFSEPGPTFASNPYSRLSELVANGNIETRANWQELSNLAYQIVATDPVKALNTALAIEDQSVSSRITNMVLGYWAQKDPRGPVDWVLEHAAEENKVFELAQTAFRYYAQQEPHEAWRLTAYMEPSQVDRLRTAIIGQLARVDPDTAIFYLEELRGKESARYQLQEASISIASALLKSDPERAAEIAEKFSPDATQQQMLSYGLFDESPARALEILSAFKDESTRESLAVNLASVWASEQPDKSQKLIKALPIEQQAVLNRRLIKNMIRRDPIAAIEYAATLSADAGRDDALLRAASFLKATRRSLSETKRKDLERRMLNAVLDPQRREEMRAKFERRGG